VIDGLDQRIDYVKQSVNDKMCAVHKKYEAGKQTVVAGIETGKQTVAAGYESGKQTVVAGIETVAAGYETGKHTVATGYETGKQTVAAGYESGRQTYECGKRSVAERYEIGKRSVVQGASRTTEKWKDLRGDLSKKAAMRLDQGLTQVREFSATRGKEIIHVDLIQYSKEVIDGASEAVSRKLETLKPMYEPVLQNLAASVLKANQAASHLRQSVLDATQRANLRERLKAARHAARELSSTSIAYVQAKCGDLVSQIPSPSDSLHKGMQFILSSPELFVKIKNKADLDASKHTLENLNNLMAAVRDVLFHDEPSAGVSTEEVEEEASECDQPLD